MAVDVAIVQISPMNLDHYITEVVSELAQEKLPKMIELKYTSIIIDTIAEIRDVFIGFHEQLYS